MTFVWTSQENKELFMHYNNKLSSDDSRRVRSVCAGKSLNEIMRGSNWEVIDIDWRHESHVVPKNDAHEHSLEFLDCKCKPKIDSVINDCTTIVHASFDCREQYEGIQ